MIKKLNALTIDSLNTPGRYPDGDGLYLVVNGPKQKSWVFRYMLRGKRREMGLGSLESLSPGEARRVARDKRGMVADGVDPIEEKKLKFKIPEIGAKTLSEVTHEYFAMMSGGWSNAKHARVWIASMESYVLPDLGKLPIDKITHFMLIDVFEKIFERIPETARRTLSRVDKVIGYATMKGYRTGDNPAKWSGFLEHAFKKRNKRKSVSRMPAIPYAHIPEFYADIASRDSTTALAIRFQMLTVSRSGEALGARWSEINWDKKLWIIPADRMKAGNEHRVPLSDEALSILQEMGRFVHSPYVFPSRFTGRHLSSMSTVVFMRKMGRSEVPHGFRSSFKDWASEEMNYPNELTEMALAHTVASDVEAAYRRGTMLEKRKSLMQDWANYCRSFEKK